MYNEFITFCTIQVKYTESKMAADSHFEKSSFQYLLIFMWNTCNITNFGVYNSFLAFFLCTGNNKCTKAKMTLFFKYKIRQKHKANMATNKIVTVIRSWIRMR